MSETPPIPAGDAISPVRLEEIEAPVRFDLGETTATIGRLQALAAGYVFELPRGLADPVTVSVNGAVVARGELVRVGDRLGVRVVEVLDHASDNA